MRRRKIAPGITQLQVWTILHFFSKSPSVFVLIWIFSQMTAEGKGRVPTGATLRRASSPCAHWTTTLLAQRNSAENRAPVRANPHFLPQRDRKSDRKWQKEGDGEEEREKGRKREREARTLWPLKIIQNKSPVSIGGQKEGEKSATR